MRWLLVLAGSLQLHSQSDMAIGIVRGDLDSWSGNTRAGELTIRNADKAVYTCSFDVRTYFEREHQMIAIGGLASGDPLEVVADHKPGSSNCYARTVHVVERHARLRTSYSPTESFAPRGNLTFAGMVLRRDPWLLTLRTRSGDLHILLRPDTRYMGNGIRLDRASLLVNAHVFVRGGRNIDGDLEAYQVVWGEIVLMNRER